MDTEDRGQSIQVGVVLLFGILVVATALYVANVIPAENEKVEFTHFETTKDDMTEIRSAIHTTGGTGSQTSQTIKLGTDYPDRVLGVNPPPVSGRIETVSKARYEFDSAFNATALCGYEASSRSIVYEAGYHELGQQPSIEYGSSVLYLNGSDGDAVLEGQDVVDGTTIQLYPLNRTVSENGVRRADLTFVGGPVSSTQKTVSSGFVLSIPTRLPADTWSNKLLGNETKVTSVSDASDPGRVNVTFEPGTYTVSCRAVGLNFAPVSGSSATGGSSGGSSSGNSSSGWGRGGIETYRSANPEYENLSTSGGVLGGVVDASRISLEDPAFASTSAGKNELKEKNRYLSVGFVIENKSIGESNYRKYHVLLGDKEGLEYQVDGSVEWKNRKVTIYREDDKDVTAVIKNKNLEKDALNDFLENGSELDVLKESNYERPGEVDLSEVRSFMNNNDKVRIRITSMHGRVAMEVS